MRRETLLALSLALGGLVIVLDTTITVVAVPVLVRVFDAPLATMQWTTTAYLLALVSTLPLSAWIAARVGTRRAYIGALVVFAVASAAAAVAQDPTELIAARAGQGLGGGIINPLALVLGLRDVPRGRRGRIASLLGLPVLVGPTVGPVLAGWLVDTVSWRAIFVVTIPPALLAAVLVGRWARADDARAAGRRSTSSGPPRSPGARRSSCSGWGRRPRPWGGDSGASGPGSRWSWRSSSASDTASPRCCR